MTANTRSKIEFKRSSVEGSRPSTLLPGEPAINLTDGKLFFQLVNGKIVNVSSTPVGNTYYVSAEGNDIDDGLTPSRALKTIRKASMLAQPGDSIDVSSGHYKEECPIIIAQNVQVQGAGERNCLIEPTDPTKDVFWVNNNSYVTGFKFVDRKSAAIAFPDEIERGTAVAVTSNTITLPSTSESIDGYYDSMQITITSGNGKSFIYNQDYCARDVGYIVDSISFDMLYGGNRQSYQSALYYYGYDLGSETIVPNEIKEVNDAYKYLANVAGQIILGETVSSYQSIIEQTTGTPASSNEVTVIGNDFDYIIDIMSNGTVGITDTIIPNSLTSNTNSNITNAFNLLQNNKEYLKAEGIAWVANNTNNSTFFYSRNLCGRDIGYIIDSICFDLKYGGNRQAYQSAVYYYGYDEDSTTVIPNELPEVTEAYNYLSTIAGQIIRGQTVSTYQNIVTQNTSIAFGTQSEVDYVQNSVSDIINIITNGPGVANTKTPIPLTPSSNTNISNAAKILESNRNFIVAEVNAYIANQHPTYTYDISKCSRDTGLIVDALAQDLLFQTDSQSNFTGIQYWSQNGYTGNIASELTTTIGAVEYIRDLAKKIIVNDTTGTRYQKIVSQNTNVSTASQSEVNYTQNCVNQIINIINHGPGAANTKTPISLTQSSNTNIANAVIALQSNREFIQSEVSAYVNANFVNSTVTGYDESKCLRDTKLLIDSVAFDILYNSNTQSQFSGLQYWANSETPAKITGEVTQTVLAIDQVKLACLQIIDENQRIHNRLPVSYDTTSDLFDYLMGLLSNGTDGVTDNIVPNSYETNISDIITTINLLQSHKTSIQDTVSQWISSQIYGALPSSPWYQFTYKEDYCYRDIGFIIDCICFDLRHGGNRQTTQAGVYYYTYNAEVSQIATERVESIAAFNYLKTMLGKVVVGTTVSPTYQNTYSQITTGNTSTSAQSNSAYSKINTITNIIANGPSELSRVPITLTKSTDANNTYAFNQILQNKDFLAAEVVGYVNNIINAPFDFDYGKPYRCYRDIGLIVDAISQDLLFQTDSQSNFTGIQYWSKDGYTGKIESELQMTIGALEYAKNLCSEIVLNDTSGTRYQNLHQQHVGNLIYSKDYCGRDVGYIVDSVSFDLLFGGNRQAFQSAVYYYNYDSGSSTVIPGELTQTTDAYNHLKDIAGQIILGETVTPYQNSITQNTNVAFGTTAESANVANNVDYIINIITNGPSVANNKIPMPLTKKYNANEVNASNALYANRDFIISEIIAYIGNTYPSFSYDHSKCQRDTGLIVDALTQDLLFQTKSQSTFTGLQYWSKNNYTGKIGSELSITVDAIKYAKNLCSKIVVNDASGTRYQTDVSQIFGDSASNAEVLTIKDEFDYITTLMTSDITNITDTIIPNDIIPSSDLNVNNAFALLKSNRKYIQAEVVAWVESNKSNYLFNPATQSEVNTIHDKFDYITNILSNGTEGVTDTIVPNGYSASSNTNVLNAYNLLQDNKEYIKAEVVAWVESNKFVNQANVVSYIGNTRTAILDTNWSVLPDNNCQYFIRIPLVDRAAPLSQRYSTFIVGSPYIYNCSSISPGATGIRVDGNLSMGNKSIVSAQFTQFNSGGTGMYIKNDGYAQLVGIYGMFCDRAFVAENGGTASMGNCNVNFGNYGLVSIGKGGLAMTAKLKGDSAIGSKTITMHNIRNNPKLSVRAQKPYAGMIMKVHGDPNPDAYYIVESSERVGDITTVTFALRSTKSFPDNTNVYFYQQSQLRASGQTYEYVGAGIEMQQVLPKYGGVVDPTKQTLMVGEGVVYATATDQNGNFIVSDLAISQATSSIIGRTFEKSLFAQMTPYILAIQ